MVTHALPKAYDPKDVESGWYRSWEEKAFFLADLSSPKPSLAIEIPLPKEVSRTIEQPFGRYGLHIQKAGFFDVAAKMTRLGRGRRKASGEPDGSMSTFANPNFVARAKPALVSDIRQRVATLEERLPRIGTTRADLEG